MTAKQVLDLKPYLSFEEQLERLSGRGMQVIDAPAALESLRRYGYYRLSGYWYPFRKTNPRGVPGRQDDFKPETSFELIVALYEFDRQLRLLAMDAVERIEVSVRVDVGHRLGKKHPQAHEYAQYLDGKFAKQPDRNGDIPFLIWQQKTREGVAKAKDEFVKHHRRHYGGKMPIWVATELWEFGQLSKFFAGMQYSDQKYIARRYGIDEGNVLASWLRAINFVRNVAAHHGRLWNRNVADRPSIPVTQPHHLLHHLAVDDHAQTRIYGVLAVIQKMMRVISPGDSWSSNLKSLCEVFPANAVVSLRDAGFPSDWSQKGLWG